MSGSTLSRLALLNVLIVVALAMTGLIFIVLSVSEGSGNAASANFLAIPAVISFSVLAYLIVSKRPDNVIGPGLSIAALLLAGTIAIDEYIHYGLVTSPGSLPSVQSVVWVAEWVWVLAILPLLTFLFLLCPDGRLPSPRWRKVAVFVTANLAFLVATLMVVPFDSYPDVANPFLVTGLGDWPEIVNFVAYLGLIPSIGLSALAMVLRFRRSTGIERLQLKWFASAAVTAICFFILAWIAYATFETPDAVWDYWLTVSTFFAVFATGIAITRYRLYDIDRIINRALSYGLLTAVLAGIYVVLVVGLQALLRPLTGGSDLAIVATTLIVATLFLPVRSRIQRAVDRKFNRRAYDAARTIEAFGARLRQQTDLDMLRDDLLAVVNETMQPARASLWLREHEERR